MDYHRRLVRQSGDDSYRPERFYEPAVILSITNSFNNTGSDRSVSAMSGCSSIGLRQLGEETASTARGLGGINLIHHR
jgi:hypothetical protein